MVGKLVWRARRVLRVSSWWFEVVERVKFGRLTSALTAAFASGLAGSVVLFGVAGVFSLITGGDLSTLPGFFFPALGGVMVCSAAVIGFIKISVPESMVECVQEAQRAVSALKYTLKDSSVREDGEFKAVVRGLDLALWGLMVEAHKLGKVDAVRAEANAVALRSELLALREMAAQATDLVVERDKVVKAELNAVRVQVLEIERLNKILTGEGDVVLGARFSESVAGIRSVSDAVSALKERSEAERRAREIV